MNDPNRNSLFIVNESIDTSTIKQELSEILLIVDSMLQIVADELSSVINCSTHLWYIQAWQQHLKITSQLYRLVYGESKDNIESASVFFINSALEHDKLRDATTAYIYQLHSLCHLAVDAIFLNNVNSHLQNSLIIIDSYMQRAVCLIDLLVLNEFKFIKNERIPSAKMIVNA